MLVIGLDVGTTGAKAVVTDENGRIHAKSYRGYELMARGGGRFEQNAADWYGASAAAIRSAVSEIADKSEIAAISMSTQGASMLAVDADFNPLCPVITWMDSRSDKEARALAQAVGGEKIYKKTGWMISPGLDAAKILWLKNNAPAVFSGAASFVSTLEYINHKLTGINAIDPTNAAIRQLYNMETGRWDGEILSAIGINEDKLPAVLNTGQRLGYLLPSAARELGLSPETVVFNGAHDQYCASLGTGAVNAGDMLLSTGTTWVVLAVCDRLLYTDNFISPGVHPAKGRFGAMCSLVSAGSALKWLSGLVGEDYTELDRGAAARRESARELFFYPYLAGAGFPHKRPYFRGTLSGLELSHDKFDIVLSLMECIAFETKTVLEELLKKGVVIQRLKMVGGAAKSPLWSGLVENITGCGLDIPEESEGCALGAAMIAFKGLCVFTDYESAALNMVKYKTLSSHNPDTADYYDVKYRRYRAYFEQINKRFNEE